MLYKKKSKNVYKKLLKNLKTLRILFIRYKALEYTVK